MKATLRWCIVAVLVAVSTNAHVAAGATSVTDAESFISAVGHYTPAAGLEVEVSTDAAGLINYKATFDQKKSVSSQSGFIQKDSLWFMYAASSSDLWVYNGGDVVLRIQFTETGTKFQDNHVVPELLHTAPAALRDRLPERLRRYA